MKISIDVNDAAVNAAFGKLIKSGRDLEPSLTAIGEAMVESTKLRFRDSKAPDGSQWRPLSPVTIALRRKGSSKPLLDTGRLRNSITKAVGVRDVVIGTNVIYAGTHQFGARMGQYGRYSQVGRVRKFGLGTFKGSAGTQKGFPIPWGNVPARPFLGLSRGDSAQIVEILRKALSP